MSQQPQQPQSNYEQVLRQNIKSLSNADAIVALSLTMAEIDRGIHHLDATTGAIWEKLDDDRAVSAREAERVKRWVRMVRTQLDALEQEMDKYQP